ncbi:poly-gamma-glutamate biosynthesis protein PgsC/CapC [Nannocystaceae bacterium ST9]
MTDELVFELLPARGLDQSMLLPVLIGLLIVLFFTEAFGWVFAGAIVPGYLASVFIIQPVTGCIVLFESIVTYLIAIGLARLLSKTDAWTRFFGRERFFLILAVSLLVRMQDHAWFAPWAIGQIDTWFVTDYESQQEFYSVGLVLVPLTANMLWKPPLHRGLFQLGVEVGITYLIVAYVLLPYTNLSLSSVELTYENTAINFVGHAKAHIILLTTAILAAQFNLTYGWDFNGILVPALLALLWLTPLKLVATVAEGVVVLYLVRGFLKLPVIKHMDFEGPRKLVLVFTLAFLWKVALGFTLAPIFPDLKISDTYGFGYLLSSLLAAKMLGRKTVRGVLLPSITTSAMGFVIGSVIGFVLELIAPAEPPDRLVTNPASTRLLRSPVGAMALARIQTETLPAELEQASQAELHDHERFWGVLASWTDGELPVEPGQGEAAASDEVRDEVPDEVRNFAGALGLQIAHVGRWTSGRGGAERQIYAVLEQELDVRRGWPHALVVPGALGPVLVVPFPVREAPIGEVAAVLCRWTDCRAVLTAGREQRQAGTRVSARPVEIAMNAFSGRTTLVMRGDVDPPGVGWWLAGDLRERVRERELALAASESENSPDRPPTLHMRGTPSEFSFQELWADDLVLSWDLPDQPVRMDDHGDPQGVLEIPQTELDRVLLSELTERAVLERADASVLELLAADQREREPVGHAGEDYVPPSMAELAYLEQQLVGPMVRWARGGPLDPGAPGLEAAGALTVLAGRASVLDYELVEFGNCEADSVGASSGCTVVLRDRDRPSTAAWGTLVVRRGPAKPIAIEAPRPHREQDTWRLAAELWQVMGARALLLAGADGLPTLVARERVEGRWADAGDPDPVHSGNLRTPFQAFHQGIDRALVDDEAGMPGDGLIVQIRGLAAWRNIADSLIIGLGQPALQADPARADEPIDSVEELMAIDDRQRLLAAQLEPTGGLGWLRDDFRVADGTEQLYRLSGAGVPQVEYTRELGDKPMALLWFTTRVRERFFDARGDDQRRRLTMIGWPFEPESELIAMRAPLLGVPPPTPEQARLDESTVRRRFVQARELAEGYARTGNLHLLRRIEQLAADPGLAGALRFRAGLGLEWGRPFVFVEVAGSSDGARALILLDPRLRGRQEGRVGELGMDPAAWLRWRMLARPQVIELLDLPVSPVVASPLAPTGGGDR